MKKVLLTILLFLTLIGNVGALELNSNNAVLYNLNENTVIFEKNKDEITSIASLTKIMTTLVAIENITDYNQTVTVTSSMLTGLKEANAAVIGLRSGHKVTYKDLLYGTFLASGADATRALTISIAGSESNFVNLMNEKAKELGLTNTNFTNTTGLDTKTGQTSTVDEVAKLLLKALENEIFSEIFYTKSYTFSNRLMTVYSTLEKTAETYNIDISGVLGGKTGYTTAAGRCLASIAYDEVNDIKYLLVTTNADTDGRKSEHIKDASKTYKYYFENFKYHNLIEKGDVLVTIPTKYVKESEIIFNAKDIVSRYLENTFDKNKVEIKYTGLDIIEAGSKKDTKIGEVEIIYEGITYEIIPIVLANDIKFSLWVFIKDNIIVISLITLILLIVGFVLIKSKKKKKRK